MRFIAALLLTTVVSSASAQTIRVIAPVDGSSVAPGAALSVTVEIQGQAVQTILVGHVGGGVLAKIEVPSAATVVTAPIEAPDGAGPFEIEAVGFSDGGARFQSNVVHLVVAYLGALRALRVDPGDLEFTVGDADASLLVWGTYEDGKQADLTRVVGTSIRTRSGSAAVVAVSSAGVVQPTGVGNDVVIVEHGGVTFEVPVTVSEPTSSAPPSQPLSGKKLQLRDNVDPAKRSFSTQSTDVNLNLLGGNGSTDDPVGAGGGTLRIRTAAGCGSGPCDTTYPLPGTWAYVGQPGQNKGYKYKDKTGLIRSIIVKPGKRLKITGKGSLGHNLSADPQPVDIDLQLAARRLCLRFGGVALFKPSSRGAVFQAKDAPAPAGCLP